MIPTTFSHRTFGGTSDEYQAAARLVFCNHGGGCEPWDLIFSDCGDDRCLEPNCLYAVPASHLAYPRGVCVYCGNPAGTKDHLVPRAWSGETRRTVVLTVPACAECNSFISDLGECSISARREHAHAVIRRKYKDLAYREKRTPEELAELGPNLRSLAISKDAQAELIQLRLAWPDDPFYDQRVLEKAGVDVHVLI